RRKAAIDRPRGRWQLNDRCTMATGELRAYMPQHLEVARYVIEHLGDVFAELAHLRTALRTAAARLRVHDRFARQVGGQRTWHAAQPRHPLLQRWRLRRFLDRQNSLSRDFAGSSCG